MTAPREAIQRVVWCLQCHRQPAIHADDLGMVVEGDPHAAIRPSTQSPYTCTTANTRGAKSATRQPKIAVKFSVDMIKEAAKGSE